MAPEWFRRDEICYEKFTPSFPFITPSLLFPQLCARPPALKKRHQTPGET